VPEWPDGRPIPQWPRLAAGRSDDLGTGDLGTGDLGTGDLGTGDLGTGR
jgi:hypothetical protein